MDKRLKNMTKSEFINGYKDFFGENNELKLLFKMGEDMHGAERMSQVISRFDEISNFIFKDKEVWILLLVWNVHETNSKKLLKNILAKKGLSRHYYGRVNDGLIELKTYNTEAIESASILYLNYDRYTFDDIYPIIYSKAGYDFGIETTTDVLAYFTCFEDHPVLLNLYDDRGMELLSRNSDTINTISDKFRDYIIS